MAVKLGLPPLTLERVPEVGCHIARFSIAGIRAIGDGHDIGRSARRPAAGSRSRRQTHARRGLPSVD